PSVKFIRLSLRGRQELHCIVVKRVDENDEPLSLIALGVFHHRNVVDENCVEFVSDLEIVVCRQRLHAEIVETKPRNSHRCLRHVQQMAFDPQFLGYTDVIAGKTKPGLTKSRVRFAVVWDVPCGHTGELFQTKIDPSIEANNHTLPFKKSNKRQE